MRVVRVLPVACAPAACLQSPRDGPPADPADAGIGPPVGPCITLNDEFDDPEGLRRR